MAALKEIVIRFSSRTNRKVIHDIGVTALNLCSDYELFPTLPMKECERTGTVELILRPGMYIPKTPNKVTLEMGLFDNLSTSASNIDRTTKMLSSTLTETNIKKVFDAVDSFKDTADNLNTVIPKVSALVDEVTRIFGPACESIAEKIARGFIKVISAFAIIAANPSPITLLGLAGMFAADYVDVTKVVSFTESLKMFILEKLGLSEFSDILDLPDKISEFITDKISDIRDYASDTISEAYDKIRSIVMEAGDDKEHLKHYRKKVDKEDLFAKATKGVKLINDAATAVKNVKMFIDLIMWLLDEIKKWKTKVEDTPKYFVESNKDKVFEYLELSYTFENGCNIDKSKVDEVLYFLKKMSVAANKIDDRHTVTLVNGLYNTYSKIKAKYNSRLYMERFEPVVIYLHGKPGCGKSLASAELAKAFARYFKLDFEECVYASPPASEYLDGYGGHKIHLIDDLGQDPEAKDWKNFCQMVSTTKYLPNMASLEEKGIPYTSEIIIATANFSNPPDTASRDIGALRRRCKLCFEMTFAPDDGENTYKTEDSKLDVAAAFTPDDDSMPDEYVGELTPFWNGKAVSLTRTGMAYNGPEKDCSFSLLEVFYKAIAVYEDRKSKFSRFVKKKDATLESPNFESLKEFSDAVKTKTGELYEKAKSLYLSNKWMERFSKAFAVIGLLSFAFGLVYKLYNWIKPKDELESPYDSLYMNKMKKNARKPLNKVALHEMIPNIYPRVCNNTFPIKFIDADPNSEDPKFMHMTTLGLKDWMYAVNTHALEDTLWIELRNVFIPLAECKRYDIKHDGKLTDLTILEVPRKYFSAVKDITKYLRKTPEIPSYNDPVVLCVRGNFNLDVLGDNVRNFSVINTDTTAYHDVISYRAMTTRGFCGSPVVSTNNAESVIFGIHMASNGYGTGFAVPIYLSDIPVTLEGVRKKVGEIPTPFAPTHTKLKKSPVYGVYPVTKEPAPLKPTDRRIDEGVDFNEAVFGKYGADMKEPFRNLDVGRDVVIARLRKVLPAKKFAPCTVSEALNGKDGLPKLDLKQASGYPYNLSAIKRRHLIESDKDGFLTATPKLLADIEESKKHPEKFPYTSFLKDELRSVKKVKAGKTRVVEAGSLPVIVEGRMIFGNLFAYFNTHPGFETMAAVGCDPEVCWTDWYYKMREKAHTWDYDYTGFDGSIPSCSFDALADLLCEFVENEDDVRRYISNIKNSYHAHDGNLYLIEGAMPSGCAGTSVFNCLINAMLCFSCFMDLEPEMDPFEPLLIAYGDDILVSSDHDLFPSRVSEWMKENTTFKITPADKGEIFNDDSDVSDVRFLKRLFVEDPVCELIHPVIETETLEPSLNWCHEGEFETKVDAISMLAFHHGPEYYRDWCKKLTDICEERNISPPGLKPYSVHRNRWLRVNGKGMASVPLK
nr:MAG: polyprotein P2-P3 [Canine picodicistrovirus]